jgi:hypothetical protein
MQECMVGVLCCLSWDVLGSVSLWGLPLSGRGCLSHCML